MKITLYELLGLVKDGKAPKKIKYVDKIFTFDGKRYCSYDKTKVWLDLNGLLSTYISEDTLNNTVEILEKQKKIPEKIIIAKDNDNDEYIMGKCCEKITCSISDIFIANKINEIIDFLKQN